MSEITTGCKTARRQEDVVSHRRGGSRTALNKGASRRLSQNFDPNPDRATASEEGPTWVAPTFPRDAGSGSRSDRRFIRAHILLSPLLLTKPTRK